MKRSSRAAGPGQSRFNASTLQRFNLLSRLFLNQFAARAAKQLVNEGGRVHAATEVRVLKNRLFERNGCLDAGNHVFAEGAAHLVHGLAAVFAKRDELGN